MPHEVIIPQRGNRGAASAARSRRHGGVTLALPYATGMHADIGGGLQLAAQASKM